MAGLFILSWRDREKKKGRKRNEENKLFVIVVFFSSISFESEENQEGQQTQLKLSVQRYLHRYRDEKKRSYWHDQAFFIPIKPSKIKSQTRKTVRSYGNNTR